MLYCSGIFSDVQHWVTVLKVTAIIDEFVCSVVELLYALVAILFYSVMLTFRLPHLRAGLHLVRLLRRSLKPETYVVIWAALAIGIHEYFLPDFAIRAGSSVHSNGAVFALLVVRCIAFLVLIKIASWATAFALSGGDRIRRQTIELIVPVLLANVLVAIAAMGLGRLYSELLDRSYSEVQSSEYEFLIFPLMLITSIAPLASVIQKWLPRRFFKRRSAPLARIAGFCVAFLFIYVPGAVYFYTRGMQYNPTVRKIIDAEDALYNSNTSCRFDPEGLRVTTFLTWYGNTKGVVDTQLIVIEVQGHVVAKGTRENLVLLNIAEPTLVTFMALDNVANIDADDYSELKSIHKDYATVRKFKGEAPFDCNVVLLLGGASALSETVTKPLLPNRMRLLDKPSGSGKR
jgi:hypothetical protein